jgi:hypothetical protein
MGEPKRKDPEVEPAAAEASEPEVWERPAVVPKRTIGVLLGLVALVNAPLIHYYFFRPLQPATVSIPYTDDYSNPATVKNNYWSTGGFYRVVGDQLLSPGVKNNPLWLKAKLPQNVVVEFDATSFSPEGDIKCEIFGDGSDHASGYVLIHGGWNNSLSIIARYDEHGPSLAQLQKDAQQIAADNKLPSADLKATKVFLPDTRMRVEANPFPVTIGQKEHWRIERRGSLITWTINGQPFMQFDDPYPLVGPKHDRFGFSSWEAQLFFDNLSITPL